MDSMSYLKKYQSILTQGEEKSIPLIGFALIKGTFEGYNAQFGIRKAEGKGFGFVLFFTIELKKRINVPFFLWPQCFIDDYADIYLTQGGRFLTTIPFSTDDFNSKSKFDSYFSLQTEESMRNVFLHLLEVVHKLEYNDTLIDRSVQKAKRKVVGLLFLAAFLLTLYFWLVRR